MKGITVSLLTLLLAIGLTSGCRSRVSEQAASKEMKRVGLVIKIKPEFIEEYRKLHSASNAGVRDLLTKAHMHNFSIFLQKLDDGNWY